MDNTGGIYKNILPMTKPKEDIYMSMEIHENRNLYKSDYANQLKAKPKEDKETEKTQNESKASDQSIAIQDEYISSAKSNAKPDGLYHLGRDENGNRKVYFNDPKKAENKQSQTKPDKAQDDPQPKAASASPEKTDEKCTTNTDKVDREIKKLKNKQQQLEQQIRMASGDEQKVKKLQKELSQVENELSQKDNDTYRRQHASVSE